MTSKEYVIWLKGFVEACHEYAPTPKQWNALKDKLVEVKDETLTGFPFGIPNTQTFPKWQEPHKVNPFYVGDVPNGNPIPLSGTGTANGLITATPGGGSITYATPQFVTSTATGYPSGSTFNYTNSTWKPEHGPHSPTIQNINESLGESLEDLENDFFGAIDGEDGWTPDLEKQFWAEQPPEPFATPEELAKYNTDAV
jgi:hypothetical protein